MVLRTETVQARLLKLEEVVSFLAELAAADRPALKDELGNMWAAERALQLGAEAIIDIGNHIVSAHFGVSAADYEDIMNQLALRGVIDGQLRDRLHGLGGFRNILVHDYLELDPERVLDHLKRAPKDFSDYMAAIRAWLETSPA